MTATSVIYGVKCGSRYRTQYSTLEIHVSVTGTHQMQPIVKIDHKHMGQGIQEWTK